MSAISSKWCVAQLGDLLEYEQPTQYIVSDTNYCDSYKTPVLTAGKSFLLGFTNEKTGVFINLPVIIFDDFTTAIKFVNFPFKVKSSAMKILRPSSESVNIKYVYYFMSTLRFDVDTHKRYWISVASHEKIPLPPLPEQHRIVAKIEELFSELDKAIESLKTAQQQLKVYRQAILKHAFEGRLTNPHVIDGELPEGWESIKISKACNKLQDGSHFSPKIQHLEFAENRYKYITAKNIRPGKIILENITYVDEDFHKSIYTRCNPEYGDVLMTKDGVNTGDVAINSLREEITLLSSVCLFKTNTSMLLPKFLMFFIQSPKGSDIIKSSMTGTAIKRVILKKLRDAVIHIPSLKEQKMIVDEIESRLSVCDKIEEGIEQGLQQVEALRQSILNKAFEGKLVPQDPNDEPASVLLARIKAERDASPEKKSRTRKAKA